MCSDVTYRLRMNLWLCQEAVEANKRKAAGDAAMPQKRIKLDEAGKDHDTMAF